jgi:UDP-N-acetylglucosamine 2-epimerase (non-hydrolysing)
MSRLGPDGEAGSGIQLLEPVPYIKFMSLVVDCRVAITDSGGIQEETSYLGVPCLTLRDNTERPITVTQGTNRLVRPEGLREALEAALVDEPKRPVIELWDGATAGRVAASLRKHSTLVLGARQD